MRPSSSRSHCTSAPATNTLPSSAYSVPAAPGAEAATVVTQAAAGSSAGLAARCA